QSYSNSPKPSESLRCPLASEGSHAFSSGHPGRLSNFPRTDPGYRPPPDTHREYRLWTISLSGLPDASLKKGETQNRLDLWIVRRELCTSGAHRDFRAEYR